jgi:hypothetical protein
MKEVLTPCAEQEIICLAKARTALVIIFPVQKASRKNRNVTEDSNANGRSGRHSAGFGVCGCGGNVKGWSVCERFIGDTN